MKSSLVSAAIHAAIIVLCVIRTTSTVDAHPKPPETTTVIYRPPPPPVVDHRSSWRNTGPVCNCVAPTKIVIPNFDTPSRIPSPDMGHGVTETWEMSAHEPGFGHEAPTTSGVQTADVVEVQVTPYAGAPTPRYPEALRTAGVEGEVTLEFVVDTAGRVERDSPRVISSTADAFVVSVRDALTATHYHPALIAGRRVRQLVRQQFVFSLTQH